MELFKRFYVRGNPKGEFYLSIYGEEREGKELSRKFKALCETSSHALSAKHINNFAVRRIFVETKNPSPPVLICARSPWGKAAPSPPRCSGVNHGPHAHVVLMHAACKAFCKWDKCEQDLLNAVIDEELRRKTSLMIYKCFRALESDKLTLKR